jgi:hypothetical protein
MFNYLFSIYFWNINTLVITKQFIHCICCVWKKLQRISESAKIIISLENSLSQFGHSFGLNFGTEMTIYGHVILLVCSIFYFNWENWIKGALHIFWIIIALFSFSEIFADNDNLERLAELESERGQGMAPKRR